MTDNNDNENEEKKVPVEKGNLGNAERFDPFAPREEFLLSKEALDARQAAIGQKRKYFGPVSEESDAFSEDTTPSQVPPTDCKEPEE